MPYSKFDNSSINVVGPITLTCEICRVSDHIGIACQVMVAGEPNKDMEKFVNNAQRGHPYSI